MGFARGGQVGVNGPCTRERNAEADWAMLADSRGDNPRPDLALEKLSKFSNPFSHLILF
jgi:hypothetical protein